MAVAAAGRLGVEIGNEGADADAVSDERFTEESLSVAAGRFSATRGVTFAGVTDIDVEVGRAGAGLFSSSKLTFTGGGAFTEISMRLGSCLIQASLFWRETFSTMLIKLGSSLALVNPDRDMGGPLRDAVLLCPGDPGVEADLGLDPETVLRLRLERDSC